jgi:hypothetical protein
VKAVYKRVSGGVSLKGPLFALVNGVLTAPQITTSSADFGGKCAV